LIDKLEEDSEEKAKSRNKQSPKSPKRNVVNIQKVP
jgi:hypothetical protein